ncbi:hydrogenase maturation nickel metallochaperone HypA [Comamonadaceae bacterium G21597-S1]|nr:hydrogenase maturation nickel metallochaperone HypA [Comamonadaceae bacterium G21597-S1]
MHELSLACEVVDMVETAAMRDGFRRVGQLRLEVGALAGVEVDALRFALESIVPGTCLAQARIDIDTPAATAWCAGCAAEVPITGYLDACPACDGPLTRHAGGDQLRVIDLLVHDD